ncbi:hydroxyacylglutathione hydrolase [Allosediminivita pacifica]|uniref:Hydroxyacylglutathione hydrolase n=1 Tax=Allosediminivita pacifica TaxID=1267769 RepID=A0A2T6AZL3_9RHOB|nr:hydroxyacylglutathione hydrolase [Allosediminivita pacifica]PTX49235.1 hydroxyacylglutathione hydrolase [Allosediminivita pacifica]GGB05664.1 hydroxyacylglutathione hydrolase [Allosediminivita pacifica]
MPLEIVTVPCRSDNYAYLIHGDAGTYLVDAPEAEPIIAALEGRDWGLDAILITHHHADHVDGLSELREKYSPRVMGPRKEEAKLPPLTDPLEEGDHDGTGNMEFEVIEVPGHTLGHIAFHFPKAKAAFTADSLMALGCGRVFEGTPEMMWESLSKLAALPPETVIYSGHEYTQANARFALTIEPENEELKSRAEAIAQARAEDRPTAQVPLSEELSTNPFLRASDPALKRAVGMQDATDSQVFAEVRTRKDRF